MIWFEGITVLTSAHGKDAILVSFCRYPESQQLVVRVLRNGWEDERFCSLHFNGDTVGHRAEITDLHDHMSFAWDTLSWPCGRYTLTVRSFQKECALVRFVKEALPPGFEDTCYFSGFTGPANMDKYLRDKTAWLSQHNKDHPFDRDGGHTDPPLSDEEIKLRTQAFDSINRSFDEIIWQGKQEPSVKYTEEGRAGTIEYRDENGSLECYYEFGGMAANLIVTVPSEKHWKDHTKIPLSERRKVLLFIASDIRRSRAPSWRFEITESEILFFN